MQKTGIVRDELYKEHLRDYPHVESPKRLEVLYEMLDSGEFAGKFLTVSPRPATHDELAWIHDPGYVERIANTEGMAHVSLDPDTQTTPLSYHAARLAAGGLFRLIDKVMDGTVKNGFALVRPPGHHAERDRAMGFCLFNNVALGARYAMNIHGLKRILIIDWDLHHGNATQHSFYRDPNVLYFSTHQFPYYPGTGDVNEIGTGPGAGYTVNVPLSGGQGDREFFHVYKEVLLPISCVFKPELILISAGFDTYIEDPLGGMRMTPRGYAAITRLVMELARDMCEERVVITLEGGYHLDGLRTSVAAVIKELIGESILEEGYIKGLEEGDSSPSRIIDRVIQIQREYWPCF
nr:histone deacetylase [Desulfobacterales bacterium]